MKYLDLSNNKLEGEIPPEIGNLKNLSVLYLTTNNLTGPIPVELENLENAVGIYLANNYLTGTVPEGIFKLPKLKTFAAIYNRLEVDREALLQMPDGERWIGFLLPQRDK